VDANLELGLPVDAREYSVAAQLLDDLGVRSVQLLTNNLAKVDALAAHGFGVTRIPLPPLTTPYNLRYLTTKRDRLGHQIENVIIPNGRAVTAVPSNLGAPAPKGVSGTPGDTTMTLPGERAG
jgi:3,4-dihydroxy 2-butanone 4-phosphate synthase / GTP cyclohydrolase II